MEEALVDWNTHLKHCCLNSHRCQTTMAFGRRWFLYKWKLIHKGILNDLRKSHVLIGFSLYLHEVILLFGHVSTLGPCQLNCKHLSVDWKTILKSQISKLLNLTSLNTVINSSATMCTLEHILSWLLHLSLVALWWSHFWSWPEVVGKTLPWNSTALPCGSWWALPQWLVWTMGL